MCETKCGLCRRPGSFIAVAAGHMNVGKLLPINWSMGLVEPAENVSPVMSDMVACCVKIYDGCVPVHADMAGPAC